MALRDVDFGQVLRNLADRRIEEAIEAGKFDNLEGKGRPLELEPLPADENARAMYWALRIFKKAGLTTDELRYRNEIAGLRDAVAACRDAARVADLVYKHNLLVRKLNTMGTNALKADYGPLDAGVEVARVRGQTADPQRGSGPAPGTTST